MNKGKIIVISGPSGVGKGSVNAELFKDDKLKLVYSVSMTTRAPRPGEVDGVNYFFTSKDKFEQAIKNNELIEHAEFIGNYYGTPRKYVEEQTNNGKNVVLEIEVDGATQVLEKEDDVISIFLMPPSLAELESRIRGRGTEAEDVIKRRLDKALLEIPLKHNYKYVVENDTVENAVKKIKDILIHEGLTDYNEESVYHLVKKEVTQIVERDYMYFVENWKNNVEMISKIKKVNSIDLKNFDPKKKLIKVLTNRIYKKVLAHGDYNNLKDINFIEDQIKRAMLTIDFFSMKQKENYYD